MAVIKAENSKPASEGNTDATPILKIQLGVTVVLAEKQLSLKDVLMLKPGTIIEFEKQADSRLDLIANNRKVAKGIAVKKGERFALQVTNIGDVKDTEKALGEK